MTIGNRKFNRVPTCLPVEIWLPCESEMHLEHLKDVSVGGIGFKSEEDWQAGSNVNIRILLDPVFETHGTIVWCSSNQEDIDYEVGVKFSESNLDLHEKMITQIKEMELYRKVLANIAEEEAFEVPNWGALV